MCHVRNERLRAALVAADLAPADVAAHVEVDPKTVERWLSGRAPHPLTRAKVAALLSTSESYLWPSKAADGTGHGEIVQVWGTRSSVPSDVWARVTQATSQLDVLVYSGGFIIETFDLPSALRRLSEDGGTSRILLGDPGAEEVVERGITEGLPSLPSRARSSAEYLADVAGLQGVELRTHRTPLYVSIYRADDMMLVNQHTYGLPAMANPVMMLHKIPGQPLFAYYEAAFDRVWESSVSEH